MNGMCLVFDLDNQISGMIPAFEVTRGGRWCPDCANLARTKDERKRWKYDIDG
ncbi:hypothetical protein SAMN05421548_1842 [Paraburkholderia lycopersici]|uniref:Uncharacterized protein n=1 Tax=Paraburkholderia lycopersici TaxID=416944 RepID=A0A1G7DTH1_9BURK|nr:hypothetical protein SAMN05421548_1842 [Paraburkholderia lycopersici]